MTYAPLIDGLFVCLFSRIVYNTSTYSWIIVYVGIVIAKWTECQQVVQCHILVSVGKYTYTLHFECNIDMQIYIVASTCVITADVIIVNKKAPTTLKVPTKYTKYQPTCIAIVS